MWLACPSLFLSVLATGQRLIAELYKLTSCVVHTANQQCACIGGPKAMYYCSIVTVVCSVGFCGSCDGGLVQSLVCAGCNNAAVLVELHCRWHAVRCVCNLRLTQPPARVVDPTNATVAGLSLDGSSGVNRGPVYRGIMLKLLLSSVLL